MAAVFPQDSLCGSRLRVVHSASLRMQCARRLERGDYAAPSVKAGNLEAQLHAYIGAFKIPAEYQTLILEYTKQILEASDGQDSGASKEQLEGRLKRIQELYKWEDIGKAEY